MLLNIHSHIKNNGQQKKRIDIINGDIDVFQKQLRHGKLPRYAEIGVNDVKHGSRHLINRLNVIVNYGKYNKIPELISLESI